MDLHSEVEEQTPLGRKRASLAAVANRRANRAAASAMRRGEHRVRPPAEPHPSRTSKTRNEIARRMAVRFRGDEGPVADVLTLDYRYWQARRCGWDVRSKEVRTVGRNRDGTPVMCEPTETVHWLWWTDLHYKERDEMAKLSRFRLVRSSKPTGLRAQTVVNATVAKNQVNTPA